MIDLGACVAELQRAFTKDRQGRLTLSFGETSAMLAALTHLFPGSLIGPEQVVQFIEFALDEADNLGAGASSSHPDPLEMRARREAARSFLHLRGAYPSGEAIGALREVASTMDLGAKAARDSWAASRYRQIKGSNRNEYVGPRTGSNERHLYRDALVDAVLDALQDERRQSVFREAVLRGYPPASTTAAISRRRRERKIVERWYQEATAVHSGVLLLWGAPGVGKSAFALDFARDLSDGSGTMYIELGDDLASLDEGLSHVLRLEGVEPPSPASGDLRATFATRAPHFRKLALLVIDNVDDLELLGSLIPNGCSIPVLIVANRPIHLKHGRRLQSEVWAVQLTLLDLDVAYELFRTLLPNSSDDQLRDLVSATRGHPLTMSQLARSVTTTGHEISSIVSEVRTSPTATFQSVARLILERNSLVDYVDEALRRFEREPLALAIIDVVAWQPRVLTGLSDSCRAILTVMLERPVGLIEFESAKATVLRSGLVVARSHGSLYIDDIVRLLVHDTRIASAHEAIQATFVYFGLIEIEALRGVEVLDKAAMVYELHRSRLAWENQLTEAGHALYSWRVASQTIGVLLTRSVGDGRLRSWVLDQTRFHGQGDTSWRSYGGNSGRILHEAVMDLHEDAERGAKAILVPQALDDDREVFDIGELIDFERLAPSSIGASLEAHFEKHLHEWNSGEVGAGPWLRVGDMEALLGSRKFDK